MTNEKVLELFLKKHRLYSSFRRQQYFHMEGTKYSVRLAITRNFVWKRTTEGFYKWSDIEAKWHRLCRDLNLIGEINLEEFTNDQ